jgi:hypothetical protein
MGSRGVHGKSGSTWEVREEYKIRGVLRGVQYMESDYRRWIVYPEYQSVCPIVGIGSPSPTHLASVSRPLDPKVGGATLSCG